MAKPLYIPAPHNTTKKAIKFLQKLRLVNLKLKLTSDYFLGD